jgi:hypothetical protein
MSTPNSSPTPLASANDFPPDQWIEPDDDDAHLSLSGIATGSDASTTRSSSLLDASLPSATSRPTRFAAANNHFVRTNATKATTLQFKPVTKPKPASPPAASPTPIPTAAPSRSHNPPKKRAKNASVESDNEAEEGDGGYTTAQLKAMANADYSVSTYFDESFIEDTNNTYRSAALNRLVGLTMFASPM